MSLTSCPENRHHLTVLIIFLIGLLVVFGIFDLIF